VESCQPRETKEQAHAADKMPPAVGTAGSVAECLAHRKKAPVSDWSVVGVWVFTLKNQAFSRFFMPQFAASRPANTSGWFADNTPETSGFLFSFFWFNLGLFRPPFVRICARRFNHIPLVRRVSPNLSKKFALPRGHRAEGRVVAADGQGWDEQKGEFSRLTARSQRGNKKIRHFTESNSGWFRRKIPCQSDGFRNTILAITGMVWEKSL
jgi:hypothetical protein